MKVRISEVGTYLRELAPVKKTISARKEERGGNEVLNGGDDRLAILWGDKIEFNVHQGQCLRACFFCLWDVYE